MAAEEYFVFPRYIDIVIPERSGKAGIHNQDRAYGFSDLQLHIIARAKGAPRNDGERAKPGPSMTSFHIFCDLEMGRRDRLRLDQRAVIGSQTPSTPIGLYTDCRRRGTVAFTAS